MKKDAEKNNEATEPSLAAESSHGEPSPPGPPGETKQLASKLAARATPGMLSKFCLKWRTSILQSIQCLVERDEAVKSQPVGGQAESRQLSLLTMRPTSSDVEHRILFVYWLPMKHLVGKPVPVDPDTRLISHVPNFLKTEESFAGPHVEIIHPAIGASMRKARDERETVPDHIMRLKHMYEVALSPCTGFEEWSGMPCEVCSLDPVGTVDESSSLPVKRCSLCLLDMHEECAERLSHCFPSERPKIAKLLNVADKNFKLSMIPRSMTMKSEESASQYHINVKQVHVGQLSRTKNMCCS